MKQVIKNIFFLLGGCYQNSTLLLKFESEPAMKFFSFH